MKPRILFLLRTYIVTVAIFVAAKIAFMCVNSADHFFSIGDVVDVLRHGLTLDLSTAFYFFIVPLLLMFVSMWWWGKGLRRVLRVYFLLISFAFALAFVADTSLYPYWGFKLDASCLQYLSSPETAAASVSTFYLFLRLLVLLCLTALFFLLYVWRLPHLKAMKSKWAYGLLTFVSLPLVFIGIRGGIDESTTNIGQVYYSQQAFLNHSAVNPVFSFLSSFENTGKGNVRYEFFSDEECVAILDSVFDTRSLNPDSLLRTKRPHIVLIMLESCGGQFTMIGGRNDITPNLNRLASEGIYFSRCYANSFRTDRATVCIWSGYPSFPTMSLQKIPAKNANLPALSRTLRDEGYTTSYYYGGDINFTKKRSYLVNSGFEQLSSQDDYPRSLRVKSKWGVCDEIVFDTIASDIEKWGIGPEEPRHLIGYNTLSSHEPWEVPHKALADPVDNAFHYLDECVGQFVERMRRSPLWDDLLIIMLPDHGVNHAGIDEMSELKMHIPMLWVGGAIREPRVVDVYCNQTDLAATLLGQLGLPHDDFLFSRDVLGRQYTRQFAFHTFNNGFSVVDSTRYFIYDLTSQRPIEGNDKQLERLGKAILQETTRDLSER